MIRRGLGKGLGALLPEAAEGTSLQEIPLDAITPNPFQPRKAYDTQALAELASSLKGSGLLQPIVVRRKGGQYELIVGERRWRAAQMAGLERIPAVIREATNAETLELALVENLLREDINPMEQAEAFHRLVDEFGWTQEELARRIGKDRTSIVNTLRILKLPPQVQADLREGRLTMGHAKALLGLNSTAEQMAVRNRILAQEWSVRAVEAEIRRVRRHRKPPQKSSDFESLEEGLRMALGTRVAILGTPTRGKIEIGFASGDELERISRRIMNGPE